MLSAHIEKSTLYKLNYFTKTFDPLRLEMKIDEPYNMAHITQKEHMRDHESYLTFAHESIENQRGRP